MEPPLAPILMVITNNRVRSWRTEKKKGFVWTILSYYLIIQTERKLWAFAHLVKKNNKREAIKRYQGRFFFFFKVRFPRTLKSVVGSHKHLKKIVYIVDKGSRQIRSITLGFENLCLSKTKIVVFLVCPPEI